MWIIKSRQAYRLKRLKQRLHRWPTAAFELLERADVRYRFVIDKPEVMVGHVRSKIDEATETLTDPVTLDFIAGQLRAFATSRVASRLERRSAALSAAAVRKGDSGAVTHKPLTVARSPAA
jgi:hypothetical protein